MSPMTSVYRGGVIEGMAVLKKKKAPLSLTHFTNKDKIEKLLRRAYSTINYKHFTMAHLVKNN